MRVHVHTLNHHSFMYKNHPLHIITPGALTAMTNDLAYDVGAGVEGGRDCLREGGLIMERVRKGRNEVWTERRK